MLVLWAIMSRTTGKGGILGAGWICANTEEIGGKVFPLNLSEGGCNEMLLHER